MPLRIDALIFDLDGTLADSIADIGTAMNAVLKSLSLEPHSLDAYKRFVGEGAENLVRRSILARVPELPEPVTELCEAYRAEYAKLEHESSTLYPGIEAMLEGVVLRRRKMAVLSNKRDDFTKHLVAQALGRFSFVDVRGEREGVPRKPDPTAAFELALELNVLPERIGFVGDTPIDVKTARNAGMISLAALWGFRTRDELEAAGASSFLTKPADLLAILDAGQISRQVCWGSR
ncbi:MAG: HAD family hydrolase [Archangium sp.]|nr:HAD family hydrolase [Archangium sp.]